MTVLWGFGYVLLRSSNDLTEFLSTKNILIIKAFTVLKKVKK